MSQLSISIDKLKGKVESAHFDGDGVYLIVKIDAIYVASVADEHIDELVHCHIFPNIDVHIVQFVSRKLDGQKLSRPYLR